MKKTLCSNYLSPTNYFCSALYSESLFSLVSSFYFSGCLWILTLLRWLRIKSRCCSNSESNSYHTVCIDNGDDYCSEDCSSGSSFINSYSINPTNLYRITLKIEYFFYTVTCKTPSKMILELKEGHCTLFFCHSHSHSHNDIGNVYLLFLSKATG